jgi:endonuclease/exonuclease/phosphatase family metal-dependent hydrolase
VLRRVVLVGGVAVLVLALGLGAAVVLRSPNAPLASLTAQALVAPTGEVDDHPFTLAPLDLTDSAPLQVSGTAFAALPPGDYRLTAADPTGADWTSASCSDPSVVAGVDLTSASVDLRLQAGHDITCQFQAARRGSIALSVLPTPSGSDRQFTLNPSWGEPVRVGGERRYRSGPLPVGTHAVEADLPRSWDLKRAVCSDGSQLTSISLDAGERVKCSVRVQQRGTITVRRQGRPTDATATSSYQVSYGKRVTLSPGERERSRPLRSGTYSISEKLPKRWVATSRQCSDGSPPTQVQVSPGERVTCTFASVEQGRVSIRMTPQRAGPVAVDPSWTDASRLTRGTSKRRWDLEPGAYSISTGAPSDWYPVASECSDGSSLGSLQVGPGEDVRCVVRLEQARFDAASFNVLGASHTGPTGNKPGWRRGIDRMATTVDLLQSEGVDVVGLQEFQRSQMSDFLRLTGGEFAVYPPPTLDQRNKQNAVAWRTSEFELVAGRPVMIPYFKGNLVPMPLVRLRHRSTGAEVYVMSVHNAASIKRLGNQQRWRDAAMRQQVDLTREVLAEGVPFIMTGDMNERERYFCAYTAAGTMRAAAGGSTGTPCSPPPPSRARIDWLFGSRDVVFDSYRLLQDARVRSASDHPLVLSEVTLTRD